MPSFFKDPASMNWWKDHAFRRSKRNILGRNLEELKERYEVGKELAKGEMAQVRLAKDKKTGDIVALKTINKGCLSTQKDVEEVKEEVAIMESLRGHPNIVALKGTLEDKHRIYIAVEVCMGGEIVDRLTTDGYYTEAMAAGFVKQILGALHYCHEKNIVHRDLKPENLLFMDNQENAPLKIVDFGMAAILKPGEPAQEVVGSPYYIAPEVLREKYGKECDIWSCGVILYLLLSGRPPFHGASQKAVLSAVLKGQPDMSSEPWPSVSNEAKDLLRQMLTKDPRKRITADEALRHPWFNPTRKPKAEESFGMDVVTRLKGFSANNKMKKLALKVVACNVSRSEMKDMKDIFKAMDKDRSGSITFAELRKGLRQMGSKIPDDQLRKIMDAADVDNSGTIDYLEFISATMAMSSASKEEYYRTAFQHFDKDGSGSITKEELRLALANENTLEPGDVDRIMAEVDKDGNGEIDFEEFVDMMKSRDEESMDQSPLKRRTRAVY